MSPPNPRCGIPNAPTALKGVVQAANNRYSTVLVQVYVDVVTIQAVFIQLNASSSDLYQSPLEALLSLIRAEAETPSPNPSHTYVPSQPPAWAWRPDSIRNPRVFARRRRPGFLSWPNNSILPSPSMMRVYPLNQLPQVAPVTHYQAAAVGSCAPHRHLPFHSFSAFPARNPQAPSSQRSPHPSEPTALPHHPTEQPAAQSQLPRHPHTGCTARVAGRVSPTQMGAPI